MEKERKEIVIKENVSIVFPQVNEPKSNLLIVGNFDGICGKIEWNGRGTGSLWQEDFEKYATTFEPNITAIINTINNGNKVIICSSKNTILYFYNLVRSLVDCELLGFGMTNKEIQNKIFNKVGQIDTTCLYEETFKKYNEESTDRQKKIATRNIDEIVTEKIFNQLKDMKFDTIIQNPPYNKSLHLDFLEKGIDLLTEDGKMVIIEPATWLINVRKNGKSKRYDSIKKKLEGHIQSVVIENLNKEFGTELFMPFATTTIDMSKAFDTIDFTCCGETRKVKSVYDCNLVGDYATIWGIFEKVQSFGDMMKEHITKEDKGDNFYYTKYAEIIGGNLCGGGDGRFVSNFMYRNHYMGEYYISYNAPSFHSDTTNIISNEIRKKRDRRGRQKDESDNCIYGTQTELENWKHFIFNNKLPLFINIVMTIDQHNNSKEFLPWLVDKQYTDEEINEMFGFTDEEIKLIDTTIKKYERNSPWFKRYMCGKDSVSDEEVNNFIAEISE